MTRSASTSSPSSTPSLPPRRRHPRRRPNPSRTPEIPSGSICDRLVEPGCSRARRRSASHGVSRRRATTEPRPCSALRWGCAGCSTSLRRCAPARLPLPTCRTRAPSRNRPAPTTTRPAAGCCARSRAYAGSRPGDQSSTSARETARPLNRALVELEIADEHVDALAARLTRMRDVMRALPARGAAASRRALEAECGLAEPSLHDLLERDRRRCGPRSASAARS